MSGQFWNLKVLKIEIYAVGIPTGFEIYDLNFGNFLSPSHYTQKNWVSTRNDK
jgi:hypothetical protein